MKKERFVCIPYNELEIIYYPPGKPFIEIKNDETKSYNGHWHTIHFLKH